MFCYQCSEAFNNKGCVTRGICGKDDEVASLQDLLIYITKGLGYLLNEGRKKGNINEEIDLFVLEALFSTVTNVNFDSQRFVEYIKRR